MLDQQLRDHFTRLADDAPPPGEVSITAATDRGRTLLRRRRAALIGVPVAAVLAVLAVALTGSLLIRPRPAPPVSGGPVPAPAAFDPRYLGASFGWLPLVQPIPAVGTVTPDYATATERTGSLILWQVTAYAAGQCRLAGHHLHCGNSAEQILSQAPGVNGRRAYWADSRAGGTALAFQYAAGGWAVLQYSYASVSRAQEATVIEVAQRVRVGAHLRPIAFPAQLAGKPAGWMVSATSYAIGASGPVSERYAIARGPRSQIAALVTITPRRANACGALSTGHYSVATSVINGYHVRVAHSGPQASTYRLCAANADGLSVLLSEPGGWHERTPAAFLTGLFRQLTLLGPDQHRWTTDPVR